MSHSRSASKKKTAKSLKSTDREMVLRGLKENLDRSYRKIIKDNNYDIKESSRMEIATVINTLTYVVDNINELRKIDFAIYPKDGNPRNTKSPAAGEGKKYVPIHMQNYKERKYIKGNRRVRLSDDEREYYLLGSLVQFFLDSFDRVVRAGGRHPKKFCMKMLGGLCIDSKTRDAFDYAGRINAPAVKEADNLEEKESAKEPDSFMDIMEDSIIKLGESNENSTFFEAWQNLRMTLWGRPFSADYNKNGYAVKDDVFDHSSISMIGRYFKDLAYEPEMDFCVVFKSVPAEMQQDFIDFFVSSLDEDFLENIVVEENQQSDYDNFIKTFLPDRNAISVMTEKYHVDEKLFLHLFNKTKMSQVNEKSHSYPISKSVPRGSSFIVNSLAQTGVSSILVIARSIPKDVTSFADISKFSQVIDFIMDASNGKERKLVADALKSISDLVINFSLSNEADKSVECLSNIAKYDKHIKAITLNNIDCNVMQAAMLATSFKENKEIILIQINGGFGGLEGVNNLLSTLLERKHPPSISLNGVIAEEDLFNASGRLTEAGRLFIQLKNKYPTLTLDPTVEVLTRKMNILARSINGNVNSKAELINFNDLVSFVINNKNTDKRSEAYEAVEIIKPIDLLQISKHVKMTDKLVEMLARIIENNKLIKHVVLDNNYTKDDVPLLIDSFLGNPKLKKIEIGGVFGDLESINELLEQLQNKLHGVVPSIRLSGMLSKADFLDENGNMTHAGKRFLELNDTYPDLECNAKLEGLVRNVIAVVNSAESLTPKPKNKTDFFLSQSELDLEQSGEDLSRFKKDMDYVHRHKIISRIEDVRSLERLARLVDYVKNNTAPLDDIKTALAEINKIKTLDISNLKFERDQEKRVVYLTEKILAECSEITGLNIPLASFTDKVSEAIAKIFDNVEINNRVRTIDFSGGKLRNHDWIHMLVRTVERMEKNTDAPPLEMSLRKASHVIMVQKNLLLDSHGYPTNMAQTLMSLEERCANKLQFDRKTAVILKSIKTDQIWAAGNSLTKSHFSFYGTSNLNQGHHTAVRPKTAAYSKSAEWDRPPPTKMKRPR